MLAHLLARDTAMPYATSGSVSAHDALAPRPDRALACGCHPATSTIPDSLVPYCPELAAEGVGGTYQVDKVGAARGILARGSVAKAGKAPSVDTATLAMVASLKKVVSGNGEGRRAGGG